MGKIRFSRNLGKTMKNGQKMGFSDYCGKYSPLMCNFFRLKSCNIMFFTILRKPHVQVLELWTEMLSANQIARFFKFEDLENHLADFDNLLYGSIKS